MSAIWESAEYVARDEVFSVILSGPELGRNPQRGGTCRMERCHAGRRAENDEMFARLFRRHARYEVLVAAKTGAL
jgi:hypothetical protein